MRIWIDKGKLVTSFDAWYEMSHSDDFPFGIRPFEAYWHLYSQVYNKDNGAPLTETYRGKGKIVGNRIYIGDTDRVDSTLHEYRVDDSPTEDSLRELEEFKSGVKAGLKPGGRRAKSKSEPWLIGFDLGKENRPNGKSSNPQWIQREGKLGGPGYAKRPKAERQRILTECINDYGYRSCLGSLQVLLRSSEIKASTRKTLQVDNDWLVKTFGGEGSFAEGNPKAEDLRFQTGGDSYSRGQWNGWISAWVAPPRRATVPYRSEGDSKDWPLELAGILEWTKYAGEISISMVEVRPEFRRMGIATALYQKLFDDTGITQRDLAPGYQTSDGAAFRAGARLPNPKARKRRQNLDAATAAVVTSAIGATTMTTIQGMSSNPSEIRARKRRCLR